MTPAKYWASDVDLNKKVRDMTDDELIELGFLGDDAPDEFAVLLHFARFSDFTLLHLEDMRARWLDTNVPPIAIVKPIKDIVDVDPDDLLVEYPHLISKFEREHYYHGICRDPPHLYYRSDLMVNRYPLPPQGAKKWRVPRKRAVGIFGSPIHYVWRKSGELIMDYLDGLGIRFTMLMIVCFSTIHEDYRGTQSPDTVWIATEPGSTTALKARDATPHILKLLEDQNVKGVVIHWYDGIFVDLARDSFLKVVDDGYPMRTLRHPFTSALGIPLQIGRKVGTLGPFFHEVKDKSGRKSGRVFGLTCSHFLTGGVDYQYNGIGPRIPVLLGDVHGHYNKCVAVLKYYKARREACKDVLEALKQTKGPDDELVMDTARRLERLNNERAQLRAITDGIQRGWKNPDDWNIGHVDWALRAHASDVDYDCHIDIGTVELDPEKFKEHFLGNVIDLAGGCSDSKHSRILNLLWPYDQDGNRRPPDNLLHVRGTVPEDCIMPDYFEQSTGCLYINVVKDGWATGITVGHCSPSDFFYFDGVGRGRGLAILNHDP